MIFLKKLIWFILAGMGYIKKNMFEKDKVEDIDKVFGAKKACFNR
jgi:hypothetical protein